uniref:Uncharacterized protein n=1 Tax=Avena sativa TaxID=4498 RepID=A0ACD5WN30_AVESA
MPFPSCWVAACGARSFRRLAVAAVQLPAILFFESMLWAVAFLTWPLRLLAAADRERKLERLLGDMQAQMERVVWENRDLEQRLRAALKEQAAMEELLDEMEEEQEDAFARIGLLENQVCTLEDRAAEYVALGCGTDSASWRLFLQVKALKKENMRLHEHKGKSMWDKAAAVAGQVVVGGTEKAGDGKRAPKALDVCREDYETEGAVFKPAAASSPSSIAAAERSARLLELTARRRSLFSVGMSLAVGGIAWSADAPCLPLLAGLLTVVGMSMCSVGRLFRAPAAARPHRGGGGGLVSATPAAADGAVALLSLNWFLLGVLTYPMLPGVARAVIPRAARLAGPAIAWFAAAAPV